MFAEVLQRSIWQEGPVTKRIFCQLKVGSAEKEEETDFCGLSCCRDGVSLFLSSSSKLTKAKVGYFLREKFCDEQWRLVGLWAGPTGGKIDEKGESSCHVFLQFREAGGRPMRGLYCC